MHCIVIRMFTWIFCAHDVHFQDAKANEVDSGAELDSQGEEEAEEVKEEEIEAAKNDEEKKED